MIINFFFLGKEKSSVDLEEISLNLGTYLVFSIITKLNWYVFYSYNL